MKGKIQITPQDLSKAIAKTTTDSRMRELVDKSPVLMLAFAAFGMELTRILFAEEKEEKGENDNG